MFLNDGAWLLPQQERNRQHGKHELGNKQRATKPLQPAKRLRPTIPKRKGRANGYAQPNERQKTEESRAWSADDLACEPASTVNNLCARFHVCDARCRRTLELSHAGPRTQANPRLHGKPEALPGVACSDLVRQSKVHRLRILRPKSPDSQRRPTTPLHCEGNRETREIHEKKSGPRRKRPRNSLWPLYHYKKKSFISGKIFRRRFGSVD